VTAVDTSVVEEFVRGTLGCACPDEVFRSVSISRVPAAAGRPAFTDMLVGSRLLIRVVAMPVEPAASGWLERFAAEGRASRDRHGYNRFRLVIATPAGERTSAGSDGLATRFARVTAGDDRTHLHLLAEDQLPVELRAGPSRGEPAAAGGTVAK
jgi:hypothetical protein